MKPIHKSLVKIDKQEKIYNKFCNFLNTDRGQLFVNNLHKDSIQNLAKKFGCKYILFTPSNKRLINYVDSAINRMHIKPTKPITNTIKPKLIKKKINIYLSKTDYKLLNKRITSELKFKKDSFIHQIETHKIKKWERKHPKPIKEDLLQKNLFDEYFMHEWNENREKALSDIRKQLSEKYYKDKYFYIVHRFGTKDGDIVEDLITKIKDVNNESEVLYLLNENHKVIQTATLWANSLCLNPNHSCIEVYNADKTKCRIVLHTRKIKHVWVPSNWVCTPDGDIWNPGHIVVIPDDGLPF